MRSLEYRGVLIRVIHEGPALQILRTEVEPGSALDHEEFGGVPACHYVLEGNPVFKSAGKSADLMPGDSIFFGNEEHYRVSNEAPSRSVILSILMEGSKRASLDSSHRHFESRPIGNGVGS